MIKEYSRLSVGDRESNCGGWGVFALLGWDVSQLIGGMDSLAAKVIYIVIGLSAVYEIFGHRGRCRDCVTGPQS